MMQEVITGSVAGTGAAINISIGFQPSYVKVFNPNDAGTLYPTMEWINGMGAGKGFKTLKIADNATTGNLSSTFVSTNGITAYAGASSAAQGFTIGADADINVSAETVFWIAAR